MDFIACFLCGDRLDIRSDKNKKCYVICNPCGVQMFVRRKKGMQHLEKLARAAEENAIPMAKAEKRLYEIQALLAEIHGTKNQIRTLEDQIGLFFPDEDKIRAASALKTKLSRMVEEFERECEKTRS